VKPEVVVRRAERAVIDAMADTEPMPAAPAVRVRADDPPLFVETWNALYAATYGTHEEVVRAAE
jgi:hypothetical protein